MSSFFNPYEDADEVNELRLKQQQKDSNTSDRASSVLGKICFKLLNDYLLN